MIDKEKANAVARAVLGRLVKEVLVLKDAVIISLESGDLSFQDLERLADEFGSRNIDVRYEEEEGAYSEYTPGSSSRVEIVVRFA